MKRSILVLVLALSAPLPLLAVPLSASETDDLVRKIEALHQARPSLQASFREERRSQVLRDPVINEGKIWATLPDKIRREIGSPNPSTTVIDGKKMVIYYPKLRDVELYDLEKRPVLKDPLKALTAGLDFQQVNTYYNVQGSKEGNSYRLTLTPRTSALKRVVKTVTVTMDQNLAPSRVDFESAKGDQITEIYSDVRRDPIPDSTFEFNAPAGTNVSKPFGG
jgi:outer membrane lipoprotein-sorting protein